jgi:hypothetical protein
MFGKPTLEAGGDGRASWTRALSTGFGRVAWAAQLDAGKQTSWNDYAKVIIPVNELYFTDLEGIRLQANYTVAVGADMAITVYMHDPTDFDQRIELSHTPVTNAGTGYRELNFPTEPGGSSWFWYGNVDATPSNAVTEGSTYTWNQFQTDSVFKSWRIYRISIDYGYQTGDIVLNGGFLCYLQITTNRGDVQKAVTNILLEPSIEEQLTIMRDETAGALKTVPTWTFGEPTLVAGNMGDAVWSKPGISPYYQKSGTGWLANLYGGVQGTNGNDFASIRIPVNELPTPSFTEALWTYYMSAAEVYGVNMVIWLHDPSDNDKRVEVTQAPSHADLEKGAGWNAHELNTATTQFFYYGENVSGSDLTAGTQYTWAQFQGDKLFASWTIYRISLDYGYYTTGTFDDVWIADIKLNGQVIPLKPDSGGSGRIGHRRYEYTTGAISETLAPKTAFRLLSLSAKTDNIPKTGEVITLTVDNTLLNATDAAHFDTLILSEDMFATSSTSLFVAFGEGYDFGETEEIDLAQTNGDNDDWGIVLTYQTVFP